MNEEQRWRAVKECVAKGDKARAKAEDWYITAGEHLKTLKAEHTGTWAEWEIKVKERAGIGKSRASELMQIADGRKTADEIRADTSHRQEEHRKRLRYNGENAPDPEASARKQPAKKTTYLNGDTGKRISKAEGLALEQEALNDIASKLIEHDSDLAFNLFRILQNGAAERLANVIGSQLVALGWLGDPCLVAMRAEEARAAEAPADVGAENMKAQIAALDDGLDIPESLRRAS